MISPSDVRLAAARALSAHRRATAARSPWWFAKTYLTEACTCPFSDQQRRLLADLDELAGKRGGRLVVAAPRGHAKSTIVSLAFVLWCLLYEKEKLILIVSATSEQAKALLKHIKDELTRNDRLRADFPELCRIEGGKGSGRQPKPWRDNRIALANGCMVCSYGAFQGLRGARNGPHRPGMIIADDLEDPESVRAEDQREKLLDWFHRTLLHAGTTATNVVVVGTVLHHDSLLARLLEGRGVSGWKAVRNAAVLSFAERADLWDRWASIFRGDEAFEGESGEDAARGFFEDAQEEMLRGANVAWPEAECYYDLMVMREREGRAAFQAEKQNEPLDPDLCVFSEEIIRYWDDQFEDEQALLSSLKGDSVQFYGACDPSLGNRVGKGDYSAIVVLAQCSKTKRSYVLAADIARRSPDQTIERIIDYGRMYDFTHFGIETNHFQQLMADNLKRRADQAGVRLRLKEIESRTNKHSRIAALEPEIAQGRLRFSRRHTMLLEQLRSFPLASHDDGPDALEMAAEVSQCDDDRLVIECLETGRRIYDSDWYR